MYSHIFQIQYQTKPKNNNIIQSIKDTNHISTNECNTIY